MPERNTHSERGVFATSGRTAVLMETYTVAVERIVASYGFDTHKREFGAGDRGR